MANSWAEIVKKNLCEKCDKVPCICEQLEKIRVQKEKEKLHKKEEEKKRIFMKTVLIPNRGLKNKSANGPKTIFCNYDDFDDEHGYYNNYDKEEESLDDYYFEEYPNNNNYSCSDDY